MIVLPILNRGKIVNVEVKLKTAKKVRNNVAYTDIKESDILVNNKSFLDSSYNTKEQDAALITEFIRNTNMLSKNDYFVSTKKSDGNYDIYQVINPPKYISKGLDNLYGTLVLDMKNEAPNSLKSRYLDFKKLGVTDHITEEKLDMLRLIAGKKQSSYLKIIKDNNLEDLIETLNFLRLFECQVIPNSSIKVEDYLKTLNALSNTYSKDSKALEKYYELAKSNKEMYSIISKLYNIVFNDSLDWIKSSNKVKIKKDAA